jgi:hypothetical protein
MLQAGENGTVRISLVLSPSGIHDHILAAVKTVTVTGLSCNRSQSLSVLVIYVRFYLTSFLRVLFFLLHPLRTALQVL